MSVSNQILRFLHVNALTVYYTAIVLLGIGVNYVISFFVSSSSLKRKLEPPTILTDPKYGVHKYIKVNNTKLHYVESGDPSKPLMVFLHGFPEFWYSWRHQIVEFNKDYWCIAIDMRGYGDSERPEGVSYYRYQELIEDVRDLIRQLGRERATLVSHDWGGVLACKYRDTYPNTLDAVVLLASLSMETWSKAIWENAKQRKMSWYVFMFRCPGVAELMLQMDNLSIFDKAMLVPTKNTITQQDIECYKYWFGKQFAFTSPVNYYRANFKSSSSEKHVTGNVPMLLVHAAEDPFIERCIIDSMKEEYKNIETVILDNCGHFLQQEEPERVNKLIREFLSRNQVL